jgi:hypothetical protein
MASCLDLRVVVRGAGLFLVVVLCVVGMIISNMISL